MFVLTYYVITILLRSGNLLFMCNLSSPNVHYPLFSRLYTSHDVRQKALLMEGTDVGNGKKDMPIN